jgi:hypothetical protein
MSRKPTYRIKTIVNNSVYQKLAKSVDSRYSYPPKVTF